LKEIIDSLKITGKWKDLIIKYREIFGQHISEIGVLENTFFKIELEEGAMPYFTQPYTASREAEDEIRKQTRTLLENGIIETSENSEWQAACSAISKKREQNHKRNRMENSSRL
jgi:hypothetical protein